ncbi:Arginine--tRNA ligase [Paenibacillus sp. P1XP2]|nr:Arginine--tRNA ligase [Paenibacillus sp. P1XP2]
MTTNPLEHINQLVTEALAEAVVAAGIATREELPAFTLEVPKDKSHGDLATNAAMQLTRIAKKNPRQIAEAILEHFDMNKASIEKADIAGPGFINFTLNKSYLYPVIQQVHEQGENYGRIALGQGQKIQVEFVSANPTGSLHLGHARGAAVGDACATCLILPAMK